MRWKLLLVGGILLAGCGARRSGARGVESAPVEGSRGTEDIRRWVLRAAAAEARGDLEEAEAALHWVLRLEHPRSPWPHVALGDFLAGQRRHDEALASYQEALDRSPDLAQALLGVAHVHLAQRHDDLAEPPLQQLVAAEGPAEAYELLARLMARGERWREAAPVWRRWLAVDATADGREHQRRFVDGVPCAELFRLEYVDEALRADPAVEQVVGNRVRRCQDER